MSKDIFGKLLQDAKELPTTTNTTETLQIDRGIDQIAKELENLNLKYKNQEIKAMGKLFLADSGIDAIEMNSNLKNLKTGHTFEKKEIIKSTNVEAYINEKQEAYIRETIEESRQNTNAAFLDIMNLLRSNRENSKSKTLEERDLEQDNKVFGHKSKVPQYDSAIESNRKLYEKVSH